MIMISRNFIFNLTNYCVTVSFLAKLPACGISFSTAVSALVVSKSVMLGVLPLTSLILALREAVVATLVIRGILFLTSIILVLRVVLIA